MRRAPSSARARIGLDEQGGGQAPAAVRSRDGHAAELDLRAVGQQAAGADDLDAVDDDEVQRVAVAPVELVREADALLDAEHLVAQRQRGVDLGLVSRRPDLGHDAA